MKLEEYQTAKAALEAGLTVTPGDSRFSRLIEECDKLIAGTFGVKAFSFMLNLD